MIFTETGQLVIGTLLSMVGVISLFILHRAFNQLDGIRKWVAEVQKSVTDLAAMIPDKYANKGDLIRASNTITAILVRVEDKLDSKMDKG